MFDHGKNTGVDDGINKDDENNEKDKNDESKENDENDESKENDEKDKNKNNNKKDKNKNNNEKDKNKKKNRDEMTPVRALTGNLSQWTRIQSGFPWKGCCSSLPLWPPLTLRV